MPPTPRRKPAQTASDVAGPRNTKADHDWIESQRPDSFRVTPQGLLQWSGNSEDIGSPYTVAPDDHRCHKSVVVKDDNGGPVLDRNGSHLLRRCPNWAMRRTGICRECAGGDEQIRRAVKQRLTAVADALVGELTYLALDRTIGAADQIKAINSLLDRANIRGGVEITADVPAFAQVWEDLKKASGGDDDAADAGAEVR